MKYKKFPKWLHRLPVLLLVLILAVTPLSMAVPSFADDVNPNIVQDAPYFEGYGCVAELYSVDEGGNPGVLRLYFPVAEIEYPGLGQAFIMSPDTGLCFNIISISIEIDYPMLTWSPFLGYARGSQSLEYVSTGPGETNVLFSNFVDFPDASTSVDLTGNIVLYNSNVIIDDIPSDALNIYLIPFSNVPGSDTLSFLDVFSGVGTWLSGAVQNISTMFWTAESGMTVLGYLAVASLALAVILLIFYLIAGWLKFH